MVYSILIGMKPFLLLQTRPENEASDNEYEGMLLASGLMPQQLRRIRVEEGPLPPLYLEQYSGIILGGGPYNVSVPEHEKSNDQKRVERELFTLLDTLVERDYPFFGCCYGIDVLGKHQGGVISDRYAESLRYVDITVTEEGQKDPIMSGMPSTFEAIVGHKEACEELPSSATLLATGADCPVQMFRVKNNLYATQFHPELDMDGLKVRVAVYKHAGYFPPEDGDKVVQSIMPADLSHVQQLLRNFVRRYEQFV